MSLSDLTIATKTIITNGTTITVHGLSAHDLFEILSKHGGSLDDLKSATTQAEEITPQMLVKKFPEILDQAIAMAADEPNQVEKVAKLPAALKIELALAVWELTFPGGFTETLNLVTGIIGGVAHGLTDVNRELVKSA